MSRSVGLTIPVVVLPPLLSPLQGFEPGAIVAHPNLTARGRTANVPDDCLGVVRQDVLASLAAHRDVVFRCDQPECAPYRFFREPE